MNRKLKKYNLRYEYLKLEEEDVREELDKYIEDFESHFDVYYKSPLTSTHREVWVNEETGEVRDTPPQDNEEAERLFKEAQEKKFKEIQELKNRPDKVKKLYKKLAVKSHPDRGGSDDLFQEVNDAYANNNLMWLLMKAGEYDIEYDVDSSDESTLTSNLDTIESEIRRMKSTLAWLWGTGGVNDRKHVVSVVESQTGHRVLDKDLPNDLKSEINPKLLDN